MLKTGLRRWRRAIPWPSGLLLQADRQGVLGVEEFRAEMGFSHRELIRGLPAATEPFAIEQVEPLAFRIFDDTREALLSMSEERLRTIASISLPVIDVVIRFNHFSEEERDAFVKNFKKHLQRGGG